MPGTYACGFTKGRRSTFLRESDSLMSPIGVVAARSGHGKRRVCPLLDDRVSGLSYGKAISLQQLHGR
jgi:hypothetical protein